jgi:CelD/BcsL family acetyltransferase involved in cellulose biosynthesis
LAKIEDAAWATTHVRADLEQQKRSNAMPTSSDLHPEAQTARPTGNVGIRLLTSVSELDKIRPEWDELLSKIPRASIFSSWEWLVPWWRAFGAGQQLHVAAFEDSASRLVALASLALGKHRIMGRDWNVLRLMGDGSHDSDNLDVAMLPGHEENVVGSLLNHLDDNARLWDFCEWNTVPQDSPLARLLPRYLKDRNWPCEIGSTACSAITLPATFADYLMQLSPKERGKIGTRTRRLEKLYRVEFRRCYRVEEIPSSLESFFELHRLRWAVQGEAGSFGLAARRQFYRDLAEELLSRNQLQFWLLELDGKAVAAQFGFRFGDSVYSLQEGYDPAFSKDSVGFVLRGHVLCQLIGEGVRRYDFLGGVNDSKTRWGAQVSSYANIAFSRAWSLGGAYILGRRRMNEGKEWLRARVPGSIWTVLHRMNSRFGERK